MLTDFLKAFTISHKPRLEALVPDNLTACLENVNLRLVKQGQDESKKKLLKVYRF